jgi:hypothetical protein
MSEKLWRNFGGEPFLINPHIISLNPKKRKVTKMARRKKHARRNKSGQFVKTNAPRKHTRRRARHNVVALNPRRRTYRRRARTNAYFNPRRSYRRRARRNPPAMFGGGGKILGMSINDILFTGAGFIAPPAIEGLIKSFLPASLTTSTMGKYAVKGGIVAGLTILSGKMFGRETGKKVAIGGATYLLANALIDFMPQLFHGFSGMGAYMNPGKVYNAMPLRGQPALAAYPSSPGMAGNALIGVPDRLDPTKRF